MTVALAFDIYGTLIDPHGVIGELEKHVGERAAEFSRHWREKQLEYTWRRGLMRRYADFGVCTRDALVFADRLMETGLDDAARDALLQVYRELPAYAEVPASLQTLAEAGFRLYAFSNGTAEMVNAVLQYAGIDAYFSETISVDGLQTFKPDPAVYHHVINIAQVAAEDCWLVSSNGFDVIGAVSAGMKAAWLRRSPTAVFDPWEIEPNLVINDLSELTEKIII